jgi:hypothetical protein
MKSFVPVPLEIIGMELGRAIELWIFLVRHQTSADGRVHYGQEIGYAWIRARWPGNPDHRPSFRTLDRQMSELKLRRLVEVDRDWMGGMRVRVLGSVKFGAVAKPALQLALLGARVVPMRAVKKLCKTGESRDLPSARCGASVASKVAPERS